MALDTTDEMLIENNEQLVAVLANGCKPKSQWRIGTEHEKFGFYYQDNSPIFYEDAIKILLEKMQQKTGWQAIYDEGNIIGLVGNAPAGAISSPPAGAISIEPGGQFELSGAPVKTLHETCAESNSHLELLKQICQPLGIGFLGIGQSPKWTFAQTPQMPKSRYDIMRKFMPTVGKHGLDMMHRTSTIQVNLDFSCENDMRNKMIVATKLQPIASALFAASPFTDGQPNGFLSHRCEIWRDTDNSRAGLHKFMMESDFSFEKYVNWALNNKMYFIRRNDKYIDCTKISFRQFLKTGFGEHRANMGDWINHLSTLFPDVRLKSFLEMRGADGGPWRRICALPAFWVGLLYDEQSLQACLDICNGLDFQIVNEMRNQVPRYALQAIISGGAGKYRVADLAKELFIIARQGLKNRNFKDESGLDETHFLDVVEEILAKGETAAEEMLRLYKTKWQNNIEPIFKEYAF